jgi:lantibiotic modifying enzyme
MPDAVDFAAGLAERLMAAGVRDGDSLAWSSARASKMELGPRPLTGLSHGTAGMGLALLEVAARTGRDDLREAGEAAFRYEKRLFSAERQNWPDLRVFDSAAPPRALSSYSIAWCHGAPGIGLARLRALQLFPGDEQWQSDAVSAVRTTRGRLAQLLSDHRCDATPCHGIAGLLELLLTASEPHRDPDLTHEALEAWRVLLSFHAANSTWPSGFPSRGRSPSLMLGLAGVGQALLRAASPSTVRSVLLVSS